MSEKGRAAVFGGKRAPFELREFEVPAPGPRDLVVRVTHANLCGTDLHVWRGDTDLERFGLSHLLLGHEMTGRIHALGAGVGQDSLGRPLEVGDRVVCTYYKCCNRCRSCLRGLPHACLASLASPVRSCAEPPHFVGAFADYYYVRSGQTVLKVPEAVPDAAAAGANCALSQVIHGLGEARLAFGDTVVVQGAGGLGLFACAVARESGAHRVIAIDAVPARLEMARAFGADEAIDMRELEDPRARVGRVLDLTEGEGADVVVEVAGVPEAVPEGIRMLARGGRYLEIGNINPQRTYKADPSLLVGFNRSIVGVSLYPPFALKRALDFLERARARYPFERLTSHRYPLEQIDRAFQEADVFEKEKRPVTRAALLPGGV